MAQFSRSTKNSEVLVLGTSLSGLLLAEAHRQAGKQVTILDPSAGPIGIMSGDLGFYPTGDAALQRLNWLKDLLRLDLIPSELECGPVHFDEGLLKVLSFVFGTIPPQANIDQTLPLQDKNVS